MNWLQGIIYGLISGLSEFIPVSSHAHQAIMLKIFGESVAHPVLSLMVHIAMLASVFTGCRNLLDPLRRERCLTGRSGRSSGRYTHELRLLKTATIPLLAALIILHYITNRTPSLLSISVLCLLNGIILFIPNRMLQGNKDASAMSALDGFLVGVGGAFSALPGISCVGVISSVLLARGADRRNALNWALLLTIPALALLAVFDVFSLFSTEQGLTFLTFLVYVLAAFAAYIGGRLAIAFMKFLAVRTGFAGFSYYSWGAALFVFVLYLI